MSTTLKVLAAQGCSLVVVLLAAGCTVDAAKPVVRPEIDARNVRCGGGSHYSTRDIRSEELEKNKKYAVALLGDEARRKYEICFDAASRSLVRRKHDDPSAFAIFDTGNLDTHLYVDQINDDGAANAARNADKCGEDEIEEKVAWRDPQNKVYHSATYAMSVDGRIYASIAFRKCAFHHSSYLAEMPVAAAGEMRVDNGKLRWVNNKSGHYWPPSWTLGNLSRELEKWGFEDKELGQVVWRVVPASIERPPDNVIFKDVSRKHILRPQVGTEVANPI